MRIKRLVNANKDWLIVSALALLLLSAYAVFALTRRQDKPSMQTIPRNTSYEMEGFAAYKTDSVDPKYPPPAKTQAVFDKMYALENMQYELIWANRNIERNALIGSHSFTLQVYNSKNSTVTLTDKQLRAVSIGCIAEDDPYRAVVPKPAPINTTFAPYEKRWISFAVEVSCMYLGDLNSDYFWRIY